jgi:HlyD family secretion protein
MNKSNILPGIVGVLLTGWLMWSFWDAYRPQAIILQGQIEAQEYSISSKVPGRIDRLLVRKGDHVEAGQLVFSINSPEIRAKLTQAQGTQEAAMALAEAADAGSRSQEIEVTRDNWQTARAAEDLAKKTFDRMDALFEEGVISEQRRDEAFALFQAAQYTEKAAYQLYSLAREGARSEVVAASKGEAKAASGLVAEVEAAEDDTEVRTPYSGEVATVFLHAGELAPQGFPVVTVVDLADAWAVFQVREDFLRHVSLGMEVDISIPALGDGTYSFSVSHISVMGDFATWRATSASEGYDLKTFEVEARPVNQIDGLRIGMTTLIEL